MINQDIFYVNSLEELFKLYTELTEQLFNYATIISFDELIENITREKHNYIFTKYFSTNILKLTINEYRISNDRIILETSLKSTDILNNIIAEDIKIVHKVPYTLKYKKDSTEQKYLYYYMMTDNIKQISRLLDFTFNHLTESIETIISIENLVIRCVDNRVIVINFAPDLKVKLPNITTIKNLDIILSSETIEKKNSDSQTELDLNIAFKKDGNIKIRIDGDNRNILHSLRKILKYTEKLFKIQNISLTGTITIFPKLYVNQLPHNQVKYIYNLLSNLVYIQLDQKVNINGKRVTLSARDVKKMLIEYVESLMKDLKGLYSNQGINFSRFQTTDIMVDVFFMTGINVVNTKTDMGFLHPIGCKYAVNYFSD